MSEPSVQIKVSLATRGKEDTSPLVTSRKLVIDFSEVKDFDIDVEIMKLLRLIDKNERLIGKDEWQAL